MSDPMPLETRSTPAINENYMAALEAREQINLLFSKLEPLTQGVLGLAQLEQLDTLTLHLRNAALQLRQAHLLINAERTAKAMARHEMDQAAHVSPLRPVSVH